MEITGTDAFKLYDTYGFPLELTIEIAQEQNLAVDEAGFKKALNEQRERARNARQEIEYLSEQGAMYQALREEYGATHFTGYSGLKSSAHVLAVIQDGLQELQAARGQEVEIILDITPCYAESGGQVTDHAIIKGQDFEVEITEVYKPMDDFIVHRGKVIAGTLKRHQPVEVEVTSKRRRDTARNHSATHLLHKALKTVLGDHVNQAGSLVEPGRLRFDFSHYAAVTAEELNQIETLVNDMILNNLSVESIETSLSQAKSMGAEALFGEKYSQQVRVIKMGNFSLELCGGTHVNSTAEIGLFKITSESSVGAGLRRIEAVSGRGLLNHLNTREEQLAQIADLLKTTPNETAGKIEGLQGQVKDLENELNVIKSKLSAQQAGDITSQVQVINDTKVLTAVVSADDMDALREMADMLRDRLQSGVIVLGADTGGKASLVTTVTKDLLASGLHAGKIIKQVAAVVGGGGGGRPDMAQAGGKNPDKLNEAITEAQQVITSLLS